MYYHSTFGFWTLENFFRMIKAPATCGKAPVSILKLVYHITLIVGAFPAIVFILGIVFFAALIPYCFYDKFQRARQARENQRKQREMLDAMFKVKWDSKSLTY